MNNPTTTNDQIADQAKQLAKLYIDTNDIGDLATMSAVVEHAIAYAYRIGYRSREGALKAEKPAAMQRVAAVLNDTNGFHVDDLDDETRDDLLGAIIDAALAEFPS